MPIHINEVFPVLDSICAQQTDICDRLRKLIETFKKEPEPVEPTLRAMLAPLREGIDEMSETLFQTSNPDDCSENPSGS
jgi:hypothetical protein